MFPTRLQVKQRFWALLDDPAGRVFTDAPTVGGGPSLFQSFFSEAYSVLFNTLMVQQVPRIEQVLDGIIIPPSPVPFSVTPADMGIADFADWDWISERAAGSQDKFIDLMDEDRLRQRAPVDRLVETVYQNGAFHFVGCTNPREIQIKYQASGEAPTADGTSIEVDSSLNFLSNYAAGSVGGNKGYEEIAAKRMAAAVGPRFTEGMIGGFLFFLVQPLVRSRQNVPIAPRPFSARRRLAMPRRGAPYVAAQQGTTGGGGSQNVPRTFTTAILGDIAGVIDGVNATFYLNVGLVERITLYRNGVLQTPSVDYTSINNEIVMLPVSIPQPGDILTAEAWLRYQ